MMRYTSERLAVCSSGLRGQRSAGRGRSEPVLRTTLRDRCSGAERLVGQNQSLAHAPILVQQVREVVDVHPELERVASARDVEEEVLGDAEVARWTIGRNTALRSAYSPAVLAQVGVLSMY